MSRRGNAYPSKQESVQSATIRLKHLLLNCTDAALAGFTPERLCAFHRVDAKVAECALIVERQRRAEQV